MIGRTVGLDEIEAAYRRIARAIHRAAEDADAIPTEDSVSENHAVGLQTDLDVLDAAFFVLIFGQLEQRIMRLAYAALAPGSRRPRRFETLLARALPARGNRGRRREIERWRTLRNHAAHGEEISAGYNIPEILARVRELEAAIDR